MFRRFFKILVSTSLLWSSYGSVQASEFISCTGTVEKIQLHASGTVYLSMKKADTTDLFDDVVLCKVQSMTGEISKEVCQKTYDTLVVAQLTQKTIVAQFDKNETTTVCTELKPWSGGALTNGAFRSIYIQ